MNIAVYYNRKKPNAEQALSAIKKWGERNHHSLTISSREGRPDYILALGGDGTMLRAVRQAGTEPIPVMGINLGGLGFLTAFQSADLEEALSDLAQGKIRIEERMLLEVRLAEEGFLALNDASFNMSSDARVIEVSTFVNGEFLTRFTGDGLICSTPTGSTAYSLAAGGPILYPGMEGIILTPICPHALSARPVVVPAKDKVTVQLGEKNPQALLTVDGQERRQLKTGDRVTISKSGHSARIVMPADVSFFQILRRKMRWGGSRDA